MTRQPDDAEVWRIAFDDPLPSDGLWADLALTREEIEELFPPQRDAEVIRLSRPQSHEGG